MYLFVWGGYCIWVVWFTFRLLCVALAVCGLFRLVWFGFVLRLSGLVTPCGLVCYEMFLVI